jgi:hypothetical protein
VQASGYALFAQLFRHVAAETEKMYEKPEISLRSEIVFQYLIYSYEELVLV